MMMSLVFRIGALCALVCAAYSAADPSVAMESAKAVWLDSKNHLKVEALTVNDGRFARIYIDTSEPPEKITNGVFFDGNTIIDQTMASFTETAAKPKEWVGGRGATAVLESPWPMIAKWDALLAAAPDHRSETKNGVTRDSSEKLGIELVRDSASNLQSVRFTFGEGPKATFIQDDYSDFRESGGRKVPYKRVRTFNPRADGKPGNPAQYYDLQTIQWNPPDAMESLSYRKGKAVFNKKDTAGNVYAPDGSFKYNEKQLIADTMAVTTGSQSRRAWGTWIVGGLVAGVVGLIILKYRKGW